MEMWSLFGDCCETTYFIINLIHDRLLRNIGYQFRFSHVLACRSTLFCVVTYSGLHTAAVQSLWPAKLCVTLDEHVFGDNSTKSESIGYSFRQVLWVLVQHQIPYLFQLCLFFSTAHIHITTKVVCHARTANRAQTSENNWKHKILI